MSQVVIVLGAFVACLALTVNFSLHKIDEGNIKHHSSHTFQNKASAVDSSNTCIQPFLCCYIGLQDVNHTV